MSRSTMCDVDPGTSGAVALSATHFQDVLRQGRLSTRQAACELGVAVSTMHHWKTVGKLTPAGRDGWDYWYCAQQIAALKGTENQSLHLADAPAADMTVKQAAASLGLAVIHLRSLERCGRLVPAGHSITNRRRYSQAQLRDFKDRMKTHGLGPRASAITMTRAEAAAAIGVHVRELQRWEKDGTFKSIARAGSTVIYLRRDVAMLAEARRAQLPGSGNPGFRAPYKPR